MNEDLIEKTLSRIRKHIQTTYMTELEIQYLEDDFPDFIYEGECFRAYSKDSDNYGSLLYWSKTIEGVRAYIKHTYPESQKNGFRIIQAHVRGIDLNELLNFLNKQNTQKVPVRNPYSDEEEILAITVSSIEPFFD